MTMVKLYATNGSKLVMLGILIVEEKNSYIIESKSRQTLRMMKPIWSTSKPGA